MHDLVSELRRRCGRTLTVTLGLAVGVALVVTMRALSSGRGGRQAATTGNMDTTVYVM